MPEREFFPFAEILSCDGSPQAVERLDVWILGKSMQRLLAKAVGDERDRGSNVPSQAVAKLYNLLLAGY
jgi:hypothetical protein